MKQRQVRPRALVSGTVGLVLIGLASSGSAVANDRVLRGELLYVKHCSECHNAQVHWREKKLATSWQSLTEQVRRWQEIQGLGWVDEDIAAVARYLNSTYYHFKAPTGDEGGADHVLVR